MPRVKHQRLGHPIRLTPFLARWCLRFSLPLGLYLVMSARGPAQASPWADLNLTQSTQVDPITNRPHQGFLAQAAVPATEQLLILHDIKDTAHLRLLRQQLEALGIPYELRSIQTLQNVRALPSSGVLFLLNIDYLTLSQAQLLQQWVNRGGHLLISGAFGRFASTATQGVLRNLTGAYWAFPLEEPQGLRLSQANTATTRLAQGERWGGVILPTRLTSEVVATWENSDRHPAVIATPRVMYLGWDWGNPRKSDRILDRDWLHAALNHFGQFSLGPLADGLERPARRRGSPLTLSDREQERPIVFLEAIALRDELKATWQRLQMAHLAQASTQWAVAASSPASQAKAMEPNEMTAAIGQQVARNLKTFSQAIANRQFREARQLWQQTQQTLLGHYPQNVPVQSEIRAIWFDRASIVAAGSPEGLEKAFDRLAAAGINLVFLETVNAGYPIYPSEVAPEQNPLIRGWDPLETAITLAHERDMELHAWIWAFATGHTRHNRLIGRPLSDPGPVLRRHPDWELRDRQGQPYRPQSGKFFLDPATPAAQNYLLELIAELTQRYAVDGIQLDYIRYPFQNQNGRPSAGFSAAARQEFQRLNGFDPVAIAPQQSELWQQWLTFKSQQIEQFVARVQTQLHRQSPDLTLSVAVFPLPTAERVAKLQQDWETWAQKGLVDLVVLMTYAADTHRLQTLAEPWLTSPKRGSALLLGSIHLLDAPEAYALDQMQLLRQLPTTGYALFAHDHLDPPLRDRLAAAPSSLALPHRQPLNAALNRYQALEREWDFLLAAEQLTLRPLAASQWQGQRQSLTEQFEKLLAQPDRQTLEATQNSLKRLQNNLTIWLDLHNLQSPWQVQTWQHRLETLSLLLNYAERRLTLKDSEA